MPLRITCPQGHSIVVSQARAGQSLRCPKCSARIVVPPPVPARHASLVDTAMSALADEPDESDEPLSATLVAGEPKPPPVIAPPVAVEPPPIWSPPPKSRALVEASPEERPQRAPQATVTSQPVAPIAEPAKAEAAAMEAPAVAEPAVIDPSAAASTAPIELQSPGPEAPTLPVAESPPPNPPEAAQPPSMPPAAEGEVPPLVVPRRDQQVGAVFLAIGLAAAALFGAAPAIWDFLQLAQSTEGAIVPRWAHALAMIGVVQGAYAIYMAQLPDWTSGWIVTFVALALSALYAAMLGITLLAPAESYFIRGLDLGEVAPTGRAAMWCLCMTSILATLAFFAGRTSLRWRAAEP